MTTASVSASRSSAAGPATAARPRPRRPAGRSGWRACLPAAAGVAYLAAWVAGLAVWPVNLPLNATAAQSAAGYAAHAGFLFALGLAAFAAHLAWQIARIEVDDPDSCLRMFRANRDAGLILFGGILLDAAVRQAL